MLGLLTFALSMNAELPAFLGNVWPNVHPICKYEHQHKSRCIMKKSKGHCSAGLGLHLRRFHARASRVYPDAYWRWCLVDRLGSLSAVAGPFGENDLASAVPADKQLASSRLQSLYDRGNPGVFVGGDHDTPACLWEDSPAANFARALDAGREAGRYARRASRLCKRCNGIAWRLLARG